MDIREWQRWISYSAFGLYISGRAFQAFQYASIAGEWELIDALSLAPLDTKSIPDQVLWILLSGEFEHELNLTANDRVDTAWLELIDSVPTRGNLEIEKSFKIITDFWIAEDDEWMDFHPRSYPDFELSICAAVAVARKYGFNPISFTQEQAAFLEPALSQTNPQPLYPKTIQL